MIKNLLRFSLSFCFLVVLSLDSYAQCPQRYLDEVFKAVKITKNVNYGGRKTNTDGTKTWLVMDIYEPKNDTANLRPLVMLMHGGSFSNGLLLFRATPDIVGLAKDLAERGYVVVSPEYRLYRQPSTFEKTTETAIAAILDINEAACYLVNSVENGNPYRIDTSIFFIGGSSAGAIIALNGALIEDTSDVPERIRPSMRKVADFDRVNIQEILDYKYCGMSPKAVVPISGALLDTSYIRPRDISVLVIHGERDRVTPIGIGNESASLPKRYGPGIFIDIMRRNGIHVEADIYPNEGHVPVIWPFGEDLEYYIQQTLLTGSAENPPVMDSTQRHMSRFFYHIMGSPVTDCGVATGINDQIYSGQLSISPNPSSGSFRIEVPESFRNRQVDIIVYDMTGRAILEQKNKAGEYIELDIVGQPQGTYLVQISSGTGENMRIYIDKLVVQ